LIFNICKEVLFLGVEGSNISGKKSYDHNPIKYDVNFLKIKIITHAQIYARVTWDSCQK